MGSKRKIAPGGGWPLKATLLALSAFLLLCGAFALGPHAVAHAADDQILVLAEGIESVNEPFSVSSMVPGDEASIDVAVDVRHHADMQVWFRAEPAEADAALLRALELTVTDIPTGRVLYTGAAERLATVGSFAVDVPKNETGTTRLAWRVTAKLPTSAGNEVQATRCVIDLHWFVPEGEQPNLAPLAKTGDVGPFILLIILALLAAFAAVAFAWRAGASHRGEQGRRMTKAVGAGALVLSIVGCVALAWALLLGYARLPFNLFETGTVSIDLNEGRPIFPEDGLTLEPGSTVVEEFTVTNTGTADAFYWVFLTDVEGELAPSLQVAVARGGEVLFSGSALELTSAAVCESPTALAPGSTDTLTATVHMAEQAGNTYQGEHIAFDVSVQAVQARNNEGRAFL